MEISELISIIGGSLGVLAMIFGAFNYFRKPQETSAENDIRFDEKIKGDNKMFDEKFRALTEKFDTRFQDMKDGVVKVMQNDLQEVKSELRSHVSNQTVYEREMAKELGGLNAKLDILIKK